ncbi:MAG: 16S rRNA processing protein RimM [Cytophagales bacterium]|nr:MAG: 16S rRNA processing protein RimM [Cytophagales bacterium]
MTVDTCFQFGKIIRPHGTKGELLVQLIVEKPENFLKKESIFIEINKKLVPFFIRKIALLQKDKAIISLEDVNSEEDLDHLLDCFIFLPLEALPKLEKGHFYYYQIIDYDILDAILGKLGKVSQVYEMPGQDMLEMSYQDCEVLIPINDAIVHQADHTKKELYVSLPTGLLEIYLDTKQVEPDDAD